MDNWLRKLLYGSFIDDLEINPNLNANDRKKICKKHIKKVWKFNGALFLATVIYSGIRLNFHFNNGLRNADIAVIFLIVSTFLILSLFDTAKLLLRNRKIDKMQKVKNNTGNSTNKKETGNNGGRKANG